jgi:hypothetical protein
LVPGTTRNMSNFSRSDGWYCFFLRLAIPSAVKKAQAEGASGVVFINAEYTHEMIVSTVWGNPTQEKQSRYPKIPVLSINYSDGEQVKNQLEGNKGLPVWFKTEVETGWKTSRRLKRY